MTIYRHGMISRIYVMLSAVICFVFSLKYFYKFLTKPSLFSFELILLFLGAVGIYGCMDYVYKSVIVTNKNLIITRLFMKNRTYKFAEIKAVSYTRGLIDYITIKLNGNEKLVFTVKNSMSLKESLEKGIHKNAPISSK